MSGHDVAPNLASRILAHSARRLPQDWRDRYGYEPVLLETSVQRGRYPLHTHFRSQLLPSP